MQSTPRFLRTLGVCALLAGGCGDDGTAGSSDGGQAGSGSAGTGGSECLLRNDTGGPGQYSDGCVKREWIEEYAGTYVSDTCKLTLSVSGSAPATFEITLSGTSLDGTYETAWDGAQSGSLGNDSYYRFTTDATFETTKTLNFHSAEAVDDDTEEGISFRVEGLDTGNVVFKSSFSRNELSPSSQTSIDCGEVTKE